MPLENNFINQHNRDVAGYQTKVANILRQSEKIITAEMVAYTKKHGNKASYLRYKNALLGQINDTFGKMRKLLRNDIESSMAMSWMLANEKNDLIVENYIGGTEVPVSLAQSMNQLNIGAMNEFIKRVDTGGKRFSERIWRTAEQARAQLDLYVGSGIAIGRSAEKIGKDVRSLLQRPDKAFRRIRDKNGKLVLSKAAKAYHPGRGIYRSSRKNALRLARNETSLAYRTSDFTRLQQLPFVRGIIVHLSASHPFTDICDALKGKYPKGFYFPGWHPQCICYTTTVLMDKKDFAAMLKSGTRPPLSIYYNRIPLKAKSYLKKHAKQINQLSTAPYWKVNFTEGLELKQSVSHWDLPSIKPG